MSMERFMEIWTQYHEQIWESIGQTFYMVGMSTLAAVILGIPLGTLIFLTRPGEMLSNRTASAGINIVVNVIRSFPFLLLVVFMFPLTRAIVGTTIGTTAATVPLAVVAVAGYSRLVEQALVEVPRGVIEAARSMGASKLEIVWKFLYVEARSGLVLGLTTSIVSFISYSTVVGIVGGGGVGDFAIRYGYQRFEMDVTLCMVVLMVLLVQAVQVGGSYISRRIDKR
ncbi:methionine ABC transporter permease [Saccharibacillus sp. CPCC 101409]|uniref:methionine ABC transporter permease n=1 Tax=Saccharibacillus sp. CPCC 101409 TaxID=3058041 RepID=UPI002672E75C|nr:methionine ABC transporter permease [Saccharibacillus sp. CPCC 101409]MDO3408228.1 methionine ABC transporter permease [Saccharibacillus sp. CPCC 101409]